MTTKFSFLQFLLFFFSPTVVVDGTPNRVKWGTLFFDLAPGRHRVEVSLRYLFWPQMGLNSVDLDLVPGQVRRIQWRAPWIVFSKGKITEL